MERCKSETRWSNCSKKEELNQALMKRHVIAVYVALMMILPLAFAQKRTRAFELKADSPKFWDLIAKDAQLDLVSSGMGFTEGPVWDPSGFVYVSDEVYNKIFRIYPDGRKEELISLGDPDGNTYDEHHD